MNRILCFTDLSDDSVVAVKYGNILANDLNSELFICHVIETPKNVFCDFQWNPSSYINLTLCDSEKILKRIIKDNHINAKPILKVGYVKNEIPSIVSEKMVDLLIFPINIKTRLNKFLLRNIIGHLVKSISCPLLMVLNNNDKQNSSDSDSLMVVKMLICCKPLLDKSSTFNNAIRISEIFSSELHLLYISNHVPRIKESQTTFHEKLIKSIKQVIPGKNQDLMQNIKIVLQKGNQVGQLLQYSINNDIDLIFLDAILE